MKKLRNRITAVFVLLIGLSMGVFGFFVSNLIKQTHMESLTNRLEKEVRLLADTLNWQESIAKMDALADTYGKDLEARVTFIALDGTVLGDSEQNPYTMKNHGNRPEVREALKNGKHVGKSEQYSATEKERLMYIAFPVIRDGHIKGVVRLALSMAYIDRSIRRIWYSLAVGLVVLLLVASIVSSRLARGITRPIEEMTHLARKITRGDFNNRMARMRSRDELGQLAEAIERMSQSLQRQMSEIRVSEERLKSVIETMPSGLLLIGLSGTITLVNPAIARLLGLAAPKMVGKSYTELPHIYPLRDLVDRCLRSETNVREEIHLYVPEERILEISLSPVRGDDDVMTGIVVVLHDVTPIRRLEKMRSEFVANVSHELKTPITSLIGFTETLLDGAMEDPETCHRFLNIIYDESQRLKRLIGDILDLSNIESRKLQLRFERFDISSFMRETLHTMHTQLESRRQTLHLSLPERLEVEGDKDRLRQIVVNLVTNAITYTPDRGDIGVTVWKQANHWQLEVWDTGIGIPGKDLPRIFERFYRVDKARSRESGGTGLGLAIVKHLVEVHQGTIDVRSKEGEGTTFTLTFPLKQKKGT